MKSPKFNSVEEYLASSRFRYGVRPALKLNLQC